MTKKERVLAALNQEPVDHVPVGFWFHFQGDEAVGEQCVQAHMNYYRTVDADLIKIMCDSYFPYPCEGIKTAADWKNLKPIKKSDAWVQEQLYRARRIVEEAGPDQCVFYNVFVPFSYARFTYEDEMVMQHLKDDPASVMKGFEIMTEGLIEMMDAMVKECGLTGIYMPVQGGEVGRFAEGEYEKLITPSDMIMFNAANEISPYTIMHCCGWAGKKNELKLWQHYPCKAVNWSVYVEDLPLVGGREFFGGKTCLGGFQNTKEGILYTGTKEEVQAFTKKTIENFGKKGLILGSDCTVPMDIPFERLQWVVDAAREV